MIIAFAIGSIAARAVPITPERQVFAVTSPAALLAAGGAGASANVPLSISYTGSPAAIQVRSVNYSTGVEITPWQTVATNPGGSPVGATFSMREFDGWQKLEVRADGGTALQSTNRIGAGLLIGLEGQSQARIFLVNALSSGGGVTANDLVSAYGRAGLLEAVAGGNGGDPTYGVPAWYAASASATVGGKPILGGGGEGAATMGNNLQTAYKVPIGFVANAPGGRAISYLNTTAKPETLARYAETGRPNYIIMLSHGTKDVSSGTTEATYLTALDTWKDWHDGDANGAPLQKYVLMPLIQQRTGNNVAAVKRAQQRWREASSLSIIYGGSGYDALLNTADNIHQSAIGNRVMGSRLGVCVSRDFDSTVTGSRGPNWTVSRSGSVVTLTPSFEDGATALAQAAAINSPPALSAAGFSILLESTQSPLTISSIAQTSGAVILTLSADPTGRVRVRYGTGNNPGGFAIVDNVASPGLSRGALLREDLVGKVTAS